MDFGLLTHNCDFYDDDNDEDGFQDDDDALMVMYCNAKKHINQFSSLTIM